LDEKRFSIVRGNRGPGVLDQWNNFFLLVGGGAATLAGLIFVALSINPEHIVRNATHKNRAINMLSSFSAIFVASGFGLLGHQDPQVLGWEWAVVWLLATGIFIRGYVVALRAGMSSIGLGVPRLAGGTACHLAAFVGALVLAIGQPIGLTIAAMAIVVLFVFLISGAWLLIVGIYEGPGEGAGPSRGA
jgi:hypothetical protein